MHTNSLDLYLIGIVAYWLFDLNSLNLEVYLNPPVEYTFDDFDKEYLLFKKIWVTLDQCKL